MRTVVLILSFAGLAVACFFFFYGLYLISKPTQRMKKEVSEEEQIGI